MLRIILNYPEFFKQNDIRKEDFLWCYGFVITRCFECIDELTFLIPHADMFNHGIYYLLSEDSRPHLNIYTVNTVYESNPTLKHPNYNIKSNLIDLTLFNNHSISNNFQKQPHF